MGKIMSVMPCRQDKSACKWNIYRNTVEIEVINMGHSLIIKLWQALVILLAFGAGYWQYVLGAPLVAIMATALAMLLAGLPLPLLAAKPLVMYRIGCRAEELNIKVHKKSSLAELADASTLVLTHSRFLTSGEPFIAELVPQGISQGALLAMAASVEAGSSHPIARLICRTAAERRLRLQPAVNFNENPGQGAEAIISRVPVRVGTAPWLKSEGANIGAELLTKADQLSLKGLIPVFVSSGKYIRGMIVIHREITFDTVAALHRLQKLKLRLMLLTGLNKRNASYIKKQTDLNDIRFEILPDQKARELQLMRTRRETIAVLGDCELDEGAMEAADVRLAWLPPIVEKQSSPDLTDDKASGAEETQGPDPDFPEEPPLQEGKKQPVAGKCPMPHISIPQGDFLALARLRHRAAVGMQLVGQQRKIAMFFCFCLMVPAANVLTPFGVPFLDPVLAILGNLLLAVFILLLSFRA